MTQLQTDTLQYWKLMQKMKGSPYPITQAFVRENELPTLAATTKSHKLSARIYNEIGKKETA